ncbi:hypothetical protein PHYPSEUDO_009132 [Phytophthora pseudosyringae]|uniref:Uncharacterized protein n=1 Tax=Phytophthora pseudosyringae TaxID=221518 RepID=A0A8T1VCJ2_9STRA|nr:hypothetical protein PHYPSEUDO_009132 [Phytophthora pseudosyringae]
MAVASAYFSWLNKREHKIARPPLAQDVMYTLSSSSVPPKKAAPQPQDGYQTPQPIVKFTETETPRKRPREGGSTASRLETLRSIKRRLEDSCTSRKRRREVVRDVESRVVTRTRGSKQENQNNNPPVVLLEESSYWLAVQKFSQLT